MRVLKRRLVPRLSGRFSFGGESQRGGFRVSRADSAIAHCTGKPSYLEPISGSMHVPIEGLLARLKKIEDRSRSGEKSNQSHDEKPPRNNVTAL
jgi:hypothetical protein